MNKIVKKCECGMKILYKQSTCDSLFCKLFMKYGYYEDGKRKLNERGLRLHKIGYKSLKPRYSVKNQLMFILNDLYKNKITTKKALQIIREL